MKECVTVYAGIPLFLQAARSLGVSGLVLNALGGDCIEDFERLREEGLAEILRHDIPSCSAARKFLYEFYDE